MKLEYVKAEEFCESVKDGTHDTPRPATAGYKLVTSKHLKDGQIDSSDAYYISVEDYRAINIRSNVEQWDVLMSMIGTVGNVAIVKNIPDYAIKNIALFKCGGSELKGKWLYYYLLSPEARGKMNGNMKGSSQQFLSLKQLRELLIPICEKGMMKKAVCILSAYDDLIENNRKQIKLLEEAAQRLYKEWFVDLRFPGHEHTRIVDGVPEGWEKRCISDIATINESNIPKNYQFNYIEYIDLSSVQNGIIKEKTRYPLSEAPGRAKRVAKDGDIIWGMVRPNLKSFALVLHPRETDVYSTGFCVLSSKAVPFSYLYYSVTTEGFIRYLINCTNGAAYPAVKPMHFAEAELLFPSEMLLKKFNDIVEPMLRQREKLLTMTNGAMEARDRLLPMLMSGEVEV